MNTIIIATTTVTVIGVLCAVMLAVASKVMAVKTDDRVAALRECLPGANCGACGYAGCDGYAEALVEVEGVRTNLCIPGADNVSMKISQILGVEFADVKEQIAVVHCRGDCVSRQTKAEYSGLESCKATKLLHGGPNACSFGCMGFGDCANICPSDAICIEDGLARINTRKCTGCGLCAKICPVGIITLESDSITTVIMCSNTEKGANTRKKCSAGCIACTKCAKECPANAITIVQNLAQIDYEKCTHCGKCAEICPSKCIAHSNCKGIMR